MSSRERRLYVGNLPNDVRSRDIEHLFSKFGKLLDINLKVPRGGAPFAFLEFESSKDADDALRRRNGYSFDGYKIRVEYPNGSGPRKRPSGPRRGAAFSRSEYRVRVTGLPSCGSWQDLKDHMRDAGEVCYANVSKDGTGIVEYVRYEDMKYAIKKLDDSRFRSHEGVVTHIRVKRDGSQSRSRSRSYSPSPKRRRSPRGRSSSRSQSRSRSRSRSPRH